MPEEAKTAFEIDDADPSWANVARDHANKFLQDRNDAARLSKEISTLESERTAMRHKIVQRLMGEPSKLSKTVATDQARLSPEYVEISQKIVHVTERWESTFAAAEFNRMIVKIMTVDADRDYENQNTAAELERLKDTLEKRIRQLKE